MSGKAGPHRGDAGTVRLPAWALGLSAALFLVGNARRAARPAKTIAGADGAGRAPNRAAEIPRRGWKQILWRVWQGIADDRILANAAGVAFYALLAVFPLIAAIVSIYGLFGDPAVIAGHLDSLSRVVPGGAIEVVREQLTRIAGQRGTALGVGFVVGLAISLWSANSGTKALFDSLNVVYEEKEERSFVTLNAVSLCFTVAAILLLIAALGGMIAMPAVLGRLPLGGASKPILEFAPWPIFLVLVALALAVLYRWGPSRREARWRWITWGSAFATLAWVAGSALFSWYAANLGSFNKTYGSLGAVIGFMMWTWLSAIVILIGGKLNAETEHHAAQRGGPSPRLSRRTLGARR
jgi:membrane protein